MRTLLWKKYAMCCFSKCGVAYHVRTMCIYVLHIALLFMVYRWIIQLETETIIIYEKKQTWKVIAQVMR